MEFKTENRTYRDFELDYKARYGIYFDHDYLEQIKEHGSELAERIMHRKVSDLYTEIAKQMITEKMQYEFHDVPACASVPFT